MHTSFVGYISPLIHTSLIPISAQVLFSFSAPIKHQPFFPLLSDEFGITSLALSDASFNAFCKASFEYSSRSSCSTCEEFNLEEGW